MLRQKSTWIVIVIMVIALGVFTSTLYRSVVASRGTDTETVSVKEYAEPISSDAPKTLSIPSLSINAPVISVGINGKGAMAVPKKFSDTGWYNGGPRPGQGGNAVIDGHVNNGLGLSGVFANLDTILPGADIVVTDKTGKQIHFKVEHTELLDYKAPGDPIFNGDISRPRLVLITCEGDWLPSQKTYDKRLVVYADLVTE